jgi:queuosine precursor transporter
VLPKKPQPHKTDLPSEALAGLSPEQVRRRTNLLVILGGIFITNALLAEIIGTKIFSLEALLGLAPANIRLWVAEPLSFNLTAGVIIWPVVFVTSDIINEYFGQAGVRRISTLTAIFIAYMFIVITAVVALPPAGFWLEVNKGVNGQGTFDINKAFAVIFRQGGGIIIASLTAFLLGQLLDVYVFHFIRKRTGPGAIWLRATGSTLVSQLMDSFVVLTIAFYIFGNWSFGQVLAVGLVNYIYKASMAVVLTPLLYLAHAGIDKYLGPALAEKLIGQAANYRNEEV